LSPENTIARVKKSSDLLICLFLIIIVAALYWNIIDYDFVSFDDDLYVTKNHVVQSGITWEGILWAFSFNEKLYWHPLTWLSHMLDCQLFGLNAGMHHTINLLLHILNTLLLFLTLRRMTGFSWCSALVALLFGIHPINVESVAWISSRKNVLSTFFWLLTTYSYLHYSKQPRRRYYLITLVIFSFGLMTKPMIVTLPCVLLLLDFWPLRRIALPDSWREPVPEKWAMADSTPKRPLSFVLSEKVPFLLLSGVAIAFSMSTANKLGIDVPFYMVPLSSRITNALVSYWVYIQQIIWPTNLAFFYPFPHSTPLWQASLALIFLIVTTALSLKYALKAPFLAVGWLWYLGTLLPAIGIIQAGLWPATANRFVYIPEIGLFIMAAWGLYALLLNFSHPTRLKTIPIFIIVFGIFFLRSHQQIKSWKNSTALYTHAVNVTSNNFVAYNNLGNIFYANGNLDKAAQQYIKALKALPDFPEAHNGLGAVLLRKSKIRLAIQHFKKASELDPSNPNFLQNYKTVSRLAGSENK
jgi:protein O-mannosyl-transferase